jgi:Zn-dependent protease
MLSRPVLVLPSRVPVCLTLGGLAPVLIFAGGFPLLVPPLAPGSVAALALLGGLGGLASLVVHELGHVVAARGVPSVRPARIALIWAGAATVFDGAYRTGRDQIRVAAGGPAASVLLAVAALPFAVLPLPLPLRLGAMLLVLLNVALALVSLIPIAPLDGYKVVLGTLWLLIGSEGRARRILKRAAVGGLGLELVFASALFVAKPAYGGLAAAVIAVALVQKLVARRLAPPR